MRPFRTLALCLAGLLCLAGTAYAQDLSGTASAATDKATGALGYHAEEGGAGADASAAAGDAAATLGADGRVSEPGDEEGLWAWFGLHLDVVMAKLHELAASIGLSTPDLGADLDLDVAEDGVDLGLVVGDVQADKSVSVPEGRAEGSAGLTGHAAGASAVGSLAGGAAVPTLG